MQSEIERSIKTIAKGAGIVFSGMVLGHLLGMVNQSILGRILGVDDYGKLNLALSIIVFSKQVVWFGLPGGISRFIPFYLSRKRPDAVKGTFLFSFRFSLIVSTLGGVLLFIFSDSIAAVLFHTDKLDPLLKYFFLGLPLLASQGIFEGVVRSFKDMKYKFLIFDIGQKVVRLLTFLPFLALGAALGGALFSYHASLLFIAVTSFLVFTRKLFPIYSRQKAAPIARELLKFSWPLWLTGWTFIFVSKTDTLLLGYFLTPTDVGLYTPVLVIAGLYSFVGVSFEYIFLPVISGLYARDDKGPLSTILTSASKWMFLISCPMLVYSMLFPREIIHLIYGQEYTGGAPALMILAIGMFARAISGLTGNVLVAAGHTKLNLMAEVVAALTNVGLNIVLIPKFGILGAAMGTSATYLVRSLAFVSFTYLKVRVHPYNRDYYKIMAAAGGSAVGLYFFKQALAGHMHWVPLMFLSGVLLLGLFVALLIPTRFMDRNDGYVLEAITGKFGLKNSRFDRLFKKP